MKNTHAQALGKLGGLARAKKLSKAKRTAIATLGGLARQKKPKQLDIQPGTR